MLKALRPAETPLLPAADLEVLVALAVIPAMVHFKIKQKEVVT